MDTSSGARTADPSGAHEFILGFYFSGVRVTRSLVLYVCFVDRCLSFCLFLVDIRILITSLWYLQTLLSRLITDWSVENMNIYCVSWEVSVYITKEKIYPTFLILLRFLHDSSCLQCFWEIYSGFYGKT